MKKLILILVLLAAAAVALGLPAAIGWFVQDRLSAMAAERLPDAQVEWDRGWFRTGLRIQDENFGARLDFRHASPGAGWLSADGLVTLAEMAAAINVNARIALDGALSVNAEAPSLAVPGPVSWQYRTPSVQLTTRRGGDTRAIGSAGQLLIVDGIGNRLAFAEPVLDVQLTSESLRTASAALSLTTRRVGQAESRLKLNVGCINTPAFAELITALRQLAAAKPDSTAAGLGAIGAASAWQQLVAAGLTIELEELVLDGQVSLAGQWQPENTRFVLTGEGGRATIVDWWSNFIGLAEQLPPEQARSIAGQALEDLAAQGAITLNRRQVTVNLDGLPPAETAID